MSPAIHGVAKSDVVVDKAVDPQIEGDPTDADDLVKLTIDHHARMASDPHGALLKKNRNANPDLVEPVAKVSHLVINVVHDRSLDCKRS
ncbi:hypothetical protein HK101_011653 [Irineochytrium annulatum]|nr:hypothetical protein HK101_011653 [Irineochytrium annulatum]